LRELRRSRLVRGSRHRAWEAGHPGLDRGHSGGGRWILLGEVRVAGRGPGIGLDRSPTHLGALSDPIGGPFPFFGPSAEFGPKVGPFWPRFDLLDLFEKNQESSEGPANPLPPRGGQRRYNRAIGGRGARAGAIKGAGFAGAGSIGERRLGGLISAPSDLNLNAGRGSLHGFNGHEPGFPMISPPRGFEAKRPLGRLLENR